jgi:hypothetical protein
VRAFQLLEQRVAAIRELADGGSSIVHIMGFGFTAPSLPLVQSLLAELPRAFCHCVPSCTKKDLGSI